LYFNGLGASLKNVSMQPEIRHDFKHRVDLYLDNELQMDEQEVLMNEVKNNPHFQAVLDQERNFRTFLRSNVSRKSVSPALIENIKERLRQPPV
jgi:hypothetical protein